ncbi:PIG-L family deacetylase [Dokdonia sp. Hel_I_53]|uniref:PIG-L family deacetylase n=1 Tax=Dokdonia sp. Hel_I_53 TaxID=1566287 RepID=UPI00119AD045|nr:PIG-L family deacetylase [Dokdonia sp. Hel_I_53]TVZ51544.1 GlcNAc-PI de-N-acetylase [Dokdonia sp. Hel_I_53]
MRKTYFFLFVLTIFAFAKAYSQGITLQPKKPTASEIYNDLQKLNFLGSVLYIAAHPDDENTTAISYFANTVKARTAYLSLTRGDGGQNIIGPELREKLGVIRTQELLAARATDGGEQLFTRANDFGYSKHPDETLAIWNKEEVLGDVVWAIRTFQPDVIINRFDHRSPGSTHGHHTSSAMLAVEAFDLAEDKTKYPDQLVYTDTWQPKRQFFNTSWWFYGSRENFEKADKSKLVKIDVGTYYPSLGLSNTEISSLSRSQHKSQGFGNTGSRGASDTYFELLRGEMPSNSNLFQGIDTSWNRVKGGEPIQNIIDKIIASYNFKAPVESVPLLVKAYTLVQDLENEHWKKNKTEELKNLIVACSGLYLEATSNIATATVGSSMILNVEAINRSNQMVQLKSVIITPTKALTNVDTTLMNNNRFNTEIPTTISEDFKDTSAYWLREEGTLGMYKVADRRMIGKPETPQKNTVVFNLSVAGVDIAVERPIVFKYNDRVKGEVYESFEVTPPVSAKVDAKVIIFAKAESKEIPVTVTAHKENLTGIVTLDVPKDWKVSPRSYPINNTSIGTNNVFNFTVTPPTGNSGGSISPKVLVAGKNYAKELVLIDYAHIPKQSLFLPNTARVVRLDIERKGDYIGYIQGAGDAVPENLEQIGYQVAVIDPDVMTADMLSQFDAVVIGIRAYNVIKSLQTKQPLLLEYVKNGGTLITQYNTSGRWANTNVGAPYDLKLSRDRVTDENSEVRILKKDHPLMSFPNEITTKDFEGWTQERGLYFPNEWSSEFTPLLSMNDKGESPKLGSLLVAPYGEGHYIYTGLSFFRELPAGVSGAYKLFANMLSIGKQEIKDIKQ